MINLPSTPLALTFPLLDGSVLSFDDVRPFCQQFIYDEELRTATMGALTPDGQLLMLLLNTGIGLLCDDNLSESQENAEFAVDALFQAVTMKRRFSIAKQAATIQTWLNLPELTPLHTKWNDTMALASASPINAELPEA